MGPILVPGGCRASSTVDGAPVDGRRAARSGEQPVPLQPPERRLHLAPLGVDALALRRGAAQRLEQREGRDRPPAAVARRRRELRLLLAVPPAHGAGRARREPATQLLAREGDRAAGDGAPVALRPADDEREPAEGVVL